MHEGTAVHGAGTYFRGTPQCDPCRAVRGLLRHVEQVNGSLGASFAVLLGLSALAFGAASWFQPRWRSRDAGRVATIVWAAVSLSYMVAFGCPRVLLFVGVAFFPFCLGALIGHNIGRFHHPAHWDGIEMDFDD